MQGKKYENINNYIPEDKEIQKYEEKIKPFFKVISVERDSLLTKTNDDKNG